MDLFEIRRLINDKLDLTFVPIQELADDIGADTSSFMSTKVAIVARRIGILQLGAHGDEVRCHRCKNGRIRLDRDIMTTLFKLLAELGQLLNLDERFTPCDDDMFAIVFRDCFYSV